MNRTLPSQPQATGIPIFRGQETFTRHHRCHVNAVNVTTTNATASGRDQGGRVPSWVKIWDIVWLSRAAGTFLLSMLLVSCGQRAREPVTLRFPHGYRFEPEEISNRTTFTQQFTQRTGIQIREMPSPEGTFDQLTLWRTLLKPGSSAIDLLGIDLIWSATLESDLVDLGHDSSTETSSLNPRWLPSYKVNGKLVAIPYQVNVGALEYRSDLLRKYGYDHPPRTWDELERMAKRIQAGERAKGRKDFWGYVWQGAANEALTCNALEWQAAEGAGRIIEDDRTISVNNPATVRAWQRARSWIGSISPPAVVAYQELDSMNAFGSGRAAFNRVWLGTTIARGRSPRIYWHNFNRIVETGFTTLPRGPGGSASTLGGSGLAVSKYSAHPRETIEFIQFLVRTQIRSDENMKSAPLERFEIPNLPEIDLISRPSGEAGTRYQQVSSAYAAAVHAVLTGQKPAPKAAADLEKQLVDITGFSTGPPKPWK